MNNIRDLNIESEILPLFDYTLNGFAKNKILELLQTPLGSRDEILERQSILKGFALNHTILKDYSYTVLYLNEVHYFLNDLKLKDYSEKKLKFKFFTSKQEKTRYQSKLNQLILFFERLETYYFSRLNVKVFPEDYKRSIRRIRTFLSRFNLNTYVNLVREHRLKDSHCLQLSQIIAELGDNNEILTFWDDLFLFEAYLSINLGLRRNEFTFPSFGETGLHLKDLYHPLLNNAVKNDFKTTGNVIVLNGPNMSGKSTFLKAVGLCLYFGHLGLGIPASYGEIPFCTNFSIEINRRDDILNGYSHFMTEIVNLKAVVEKAAEGNRCFAIFDELFSGTNVEDALEICKTTINGLSKFDNSYFFISTHIQDLKSVSNHQVETYYIDCELFDDKPTFTYKLKKGWSAIKVGRILFEKEGLNKLLT